MDSTAWITESLAHPLAWATARAQALGARDWLVLAGILVFQRLCVHIGMWTYCLAVLPGTALHEAMHWTAAALLGARPTMPNLVPVRTAMGWRLGSVRFQAGYLRSLPIALAPVALAPLSFWWATTFMPGAGSGVAYGLHAWLAASAFGASVPSSQDWSVAAPALLVGAVVGVALWVAL